MSNLPKTQNAVQLVGPDELVLNKTRQVPAPGPHQVLCRVEAVGLCFSDLKLLKQFSSHVRKGKIISGIDFNILKEIPSYVPDEKPTVPGHETVVQIETVGPKVKDFKPGQRYLVQTDYRRLKTAGSNAAFGYNFEGALQEYVLMDQRIITTPEGDSMLIPVSQQLSASALALIEPWACVENAYANRERQTIKANGQLLIVDDVQFPGSGNILGNFLERYKKPVQITLLSKYHLPSGFENIVTKTVTNISELKGIDYDDVIYFGPNPDTVEKLFEKLAGNGILNIVLCGGRFARDVVTPVGRIHYEGIRIIGTTGSDPTESMQTIPQTGEIRSGDKINIIGAAGPMGMMHAIRSICQGVSNVSVFAGDLDNNRLAFLSRIAEPLANQNTVEYKSYNPIEQNLEISFNYTVLMAPLAGLVTSAVADAAEHGIINIFAGIPATVTSRLNLNEYIEKKLYFIGTSGSVLDDMKRVLAKVQSSRLDTNFSVAAISGLDGAVEAIHAIENRSIPGKIIVYPTCKGLGLVPLEQLNGKLPEVAEHLNNGLWTKQAEQKLIKIYTN